MKRYSKLFLSLATMLLFASCDKYVVQYVWNKGEKGSEEDPVGELVEKTFAATLDKGSFAQADIIDIFWGKTALSRTSASVPAAGTLVNIKASVVETSDYYAALGSNPDNAYLGKGKLNVVIPSSQHGNLSECCIAAAHSTSTETNFQFVRLNSVTKFTLTRSDVAQAVVRATDASSLSGTCMVVFDASGKPAASLEQGSAEIKVLPSSGDFLTPGDYYIAMAPLGKLSEGLTFNCKGADGAALTKPFQAKDVELVCGEVFDAGEVDKSSGPLIQNYFVTPDGCGDKSGKDWGNAMGAAEMRSLLLYDGTDCTENALAVNGRNFRLSAGTYLIPDEGLQFCPVAFNEYGAAVTFGIYGGYPASSTGTDISTRDIVANETVFSGSESGACLAVGAYANMTVNGVTFTKSKGLSVRSDFPGKPEPRALTVYDATAVVNLQNCKFDRNSENVNKGGAALLVSKGAVYAENCLFTANESKSQGGAVRADNQEDCLLFMHGCKFYDNRIGDSATYGTAMFARGSVCLDRCTFYGNNEKAGVNQPVINLNYNYILSNNTIMGSSAFGTGTGLIRSETKTSDGYVGYYINNRIVNISDDISMKCWAVLASQTGPTSGGYNVFVGKDGGISHIARFPSVGTDVDTNSLSTTYSFNPLTYEVTWGGNISGHSEPDAKTVLSGIRSVSPSTGMSDIGTRFADWLVSIGAL
ncbi:MAG: hypothetical protein MJY62_00965 [Bacteroidales bacterium]|nr:hypothetical protein [Bacteroidales bacterium]